ncbi:MAG TPA: hypothetical protein VMV77_01355 [Bacteroidales bacterium]|nr:hypothetical protein [Bacteroidales bacterium]
MFIETLSGKKFYFNNPQPDQIWIVDIASGMAKICRYAGQIPRYYSVAEHVVLGLNYLQSGDLNTRRAWFLHDASEAYLADVPGPVKEMLPEYQRIESLVMSVIFNKYGVNYDEAIHKTIRFLDRMMLRNEAEVMGKHIQDWEWAKDYPKIEGFSPNYWGYEEAERQFIIAFEELFNYGSTR